MNISEAELRSMVKDVDEQHRDGMDSMADNIRELHDGEGLKLMGNARRRFLQGAGLGAAAVTVGPAVLPLSRLWSPAFAGAGSGDGALAAFAQSVELAAVEAYGAAAGSGKVTTPAVVMVATTFAAQHQEHADAFGGAAGDAATDAPNPGLLEEFGPMIEAAADENAILELAYGLENAAASTYLFALGALESTEALQLTASILPVEAQHAIVIGSVLGKSVPDMVPAFENTDQALSPDQYPVG